MGEPRTEPSHPGDILELHVMNSLYSSARSQQERQDAEMSRNPSPVARLRIEHYDERTALKQRHEREVEELKLKHHKQRSAAVAKHVSTHHERPRRRVVVGLPGPDEAPERKHLAERQESERQKLAESHNREMTMALRQHGHAK